MSALVVMPPLLKLRTYLEFTSIHNYTTLIRIGCCNNYHHNNLEDFLVPNHCLTLLLVMTFFMVLLLCAVWLCCVCVTGIDLRFSAMQCGLCDSSVVGVARWLWAVLLFVLWWCDRSKLSLSIMCSC